jgi:hypothetical protein
VPARRPGLSIESAPCGPFDPVGDAVSCHKSDLATFGSEFDRRSMSSKGHATRG